MAKWEQASSSIYKIAKYKNAKYKHSVEHWQYTTSPVIDLIKDSNGHYEVIFNKRTKALGQCDLTTAMEISGQFAMRQIDLELQKLLATKEEIFYMD